MTRLR